MKDIKVFRLRVRLKNGTSGTVTTETHLILAKDEENAISEFRKWFALNRYSDSSGVRIDDISVEISDNVICPSTACFPTSCEGCENIGLRYPYASMYPCTNCRRANSRDFYKGKELSNICNISSLFWKVSSLSFPPACFRCFQSMFPISPVADSEPRARP